jgi:hypothetical protein
MKLLIRIVLLGIIVVLGFTVIFPEWFDFRDQLIAEHHAEKSASQQRARLQNAQRFHEERVADLKQHEPRALDFSRNVWNEVSRGSYSTLFERGTPSFAQEKTAANSDELRVIYTTMGRELTHDEAASAPGYNPDTQQRTYLDTGVEDLVTEVRYWGEHAAALQTLHLKLVDGRFAVDWALIEVFLYPGREAEVPDASRGPHVFRGN